MSDNKNKNKISDMVTNQFDDTFDNVIDDLIEFLEKKDFKQKLVKNINKHVDIPIIDEKTEKKIINSLYDTIVKELKNINKD